MVGYYNRELVHELRRMRVALLGGVSYPGELAAHLGLGRSNVSNYLSCLRGCGLVVATYEGRSVRYALSDPHLARALGELTQLVLAVEPTEQCVDEQEQPTGAATGVHR